MLYVCTGDVMDAVFSVCIVTCGAVQSAFRRFLGVIVPTL